LGEKGLCDNQKKGPKTIKTVPVRIDQATGRFNGATSKKNILIGEKWTGRGP